MTVVSFMMHHNEMLSLHLREYAAVVIFLLSLSLQAGASSHVTLPAHEMAFDGANSTLVSRVNVTGPLSEEPEFLAFNRQSNAVTQPQSVHFAEPAGGFDWYT